MKTVIMAGGKGTRISSIASDIPKPMIPINGMPVLEREIACLKEQGFDDIIITVSHLGDIIMDYFGDGTKISPITGRPFGVKIDYFFEKEPLGNAGALFMPEVKEKLEKDNDEDFLLLNADSIFDIDFNRFVKFHKKHEKPVTLFTHPNNHPYDSGLLITDENNVVKQWLTKEDDRPKYYKNRVNAGLHVISKKILQLEFKPSKENKIDLDRQILKPMSDRKLLVSYDSPEYVRDMGTPERYLRVQQDFKDGIVQSKNLSKKQKAIFLDRDGTINKYKGFIRNIEDIELIDGVADAIRKINEMGYLAIVVTNQPVIARGEATVQEVNEMHNKIETLLGNDGAYIDGLYYCPHHPDKGFEGEVEELKIKCNCRKPEPGMLLRATKDFNIDLKESWMIGDSKNDIIAGKKAGCKTALIGHDEIGSNLKGESLIQLINQIEELNKERIELDKDDECK